MATRRPQVPIPEKGVLVSTPRKTFLDKLEDFISAGVEAAFFISLYPIGQLCAWISERNKDNK